MMAPRYIVRRIGSEYRIIRSDAQGVISSSLLVAGGIGVGLLGIWRGRFTAIAGLLAGAAAVYYGLTGENALHSLGQCLSREPLQQSRGPSHQHSEKTAGDQRPEDAVDEASMESFPASDAPARTSSTSSS